MSRPVGRHRARRDTGIYALRRPAVAATAAISTISVAAAAYSTAASANASVAGSPRASIAFGTAETSSTALLAANSAVAGDGQAQLSAAQQAVAARAAADAKARGAAAASATAASKLQAQAAESAKAALKAAADKTATAPAAASQPSSDPTPPSTSRGGSRPTYSGSPQAIAAAMLSSYGWGQDQMGCLVSLWNRESGWNVSASNPSSGAYGIPQSLPGSKMASAGADWQTNPATQIRWGLGYIQATYGSPCGAWGHSQATGWY
ncbi:lytic transglycosylase domain-containing protein [Flexivirga caeni]|uniref:aggregation-promoting factor C-terminal-like domain-containing protein n=1 Tax=Flexivirga caeni TaxID=2294115 RepID=UPI001C65968E|nr:lytic transglycosylase domain-containing protein [Flexivirga caeni]